MNIHIKKYIKNNTMLYQLLVYFVLIITITLTISSYFTYTYFSSSFKGEVTNLNNRILNQVRIFSDDFVLKRVNEMSLNLIMGNRGNYYIDAFLDDSVQNKSDLLPTLYRQLDNIVLENRDIVDSLLIHSKDSELLVASKFIKYINEEAAGETEEFNWLSQFYKSGRSMMWFKTRNAAVYSDPGNYRGDIITVVYSYPLASTGSEVKGCIAVNIKEDSLNEYLMRFNSVEFGQLMILDKSGNIVSHSDKSSIYNDISKENYVKKIIESRSNLEFETKIGNAEYVISSIPSQYNNNWYYVSIIPRELFFQRDYYIKKNILIVSIVILLIVFILSNIFSLKIYVPFKNILDKYSSTTGDTTIKNKNLNEYGLLDNMFASMTNKITDLQYTVKKNSLMIRHNVLNDLLSNRIGKEDEADNMLKLASIGFEHKFFLVMVFYLSDIERQDQIQYYKYSMIDFINSINFDDLSINPVDTGSKSFAVIINAAASDYDIIDILVDKLQNFCFSQFGINLPVGIGRFEENLPSIHKSYVESMIALQYRFIYHKEVIFFYNKLEQSIKNDIKHNDQFSDKLEKQINMSNIEDIRNILMEFKSAMIENNLSYKEVRRVVSIFTSKLKYYCTAMSVDLIEVAGKNVSNGLLFPCNIVMFSDCYILAYKKIFEYISERKFSKNFDLIESVKSYVLENLNLELSLASSAEAVNISPFYLSKMFKDETGENYIEYVVRCKMEKAKELLIDPNLNIEKVTLMVGYNHATYFRRKFKEYTGKTPNEYRNDIQGKV